MTNDLVTIIMLSRNRAKYLMESINSVMNQTYQNWELYFLDDSSDDGTITQMMDLMGKDKRIKVHQTVSERGSGVNRNSALREVNGRWVAFLDVGDLWEPTKLEKQIAFMEEKGYPASYTNYTIIDEKGTPQSGIISGPSVITWSNLIKCCWAEYLTVMYDVNIIGRLKLNYLFENNDYSLILKICDQVEMYLLNECLGINRVFKKNLFNYPLNRRIRWRYEIYRVDQHLNPFISLCMTVRNFYYTMVRRFKYMK